MTCESGATDLPRTSKPVPEACNLMASLKMDQPMVTNRETLKEAQKLGENNLDDF
jgi:hypothetical protein